MVLMHGFRGKEGREGGRRLYIQRGREWRVCPGVVQNVLSTFGAVATYINMLDGNYSLLSKRSNDLSM